MASASAFKTWTLTIGHFVSVYLLGSAAVSCVCPGIYPSVPGLPSVWHRLLQGSVSWPLYWTANWQCPLLSLELYSLGISVFCFLVRLANVFSVLIIPLKPALCFTNHFCHISLLYLINVWPVPFLIFLDQVWVTLALLTPSDALALVAVYCFISFYFWSMHLLLKIGFL